MENEKIGVIYQRLIMPGRPPKQEPINCPNGVVGI